MLKLKFSDIISIIDLLLTSGIGIWIGVTVQNNLTNNRALKAYFIDEIKIINDEYATFLNSLFRDQTSSNKVIEWCKIMNMRIETLQSFILDKSDVLPEVLAQHINLKHYITNTPEFNQQFNSPTLKLLPNTRNMVLEYHSKLKRSIVKAIVEINGAKIRK